MQPDTEGFLHPQIDPNTCTNCDLCRLICPANADTTTPRRYDGPDKLPAPKVFAAWQLDESIRRDSSSGGVFTALAENILSKGGIVAGAAFDDQLVVRNILVETQKELHRLRGSKYVQSEISPDLYWRLRELLKAGRPVLFTGTPCQVAGLHAFLGKDYQNLCTCDLVCHGVPSPKVFADYRAMMECQYGARPKRIAFRRKNCGWKRYSVSLSFDNDTEYRRVFNDDPFMTGFLQNTYLRPCCHTCTFSRLPRVADVTLGDFWGIGDHHPEWDDDKGTSLILVNTEAGSGAFNTCKDSLIVHDADLKDAIRSNPCICNQVPAGERRTAFFNDLDRLPFDKVLAKHTSVPPLWRRVAGKIQRLALALIQKVTKSMVP